MSWCEKQSEKLYVTKDIIDVERIVNEFVGNNCYKNGYLLRIFTLKTPETITNHIEVDEDPGVVEIPVPIRDMDRLVELEHYRFDKLYGRLVEFMKQKIKQEYFNHHRRTTSLTTINDLLGIIVTVTDNDYFTFGDESRVNVIQRIAQRNKRLIDLDEKRYEMGVYSYLIELISYLLFDTYQPIEENLDTILMRASNLQTRETIGLPNEIKISEQVIEPIYQIAEHFRFSNNVTIPIDHIQDKQELAYFLKRFYDVHIKNIVEITEIELFVFYFVMGLLRLIQADRETVYTNYILTAQDHLFWLNDEKYKKTIDIFYNHELDY